MKEKFLSALMKNIILAKNEFPDRYNWTDQDVFQIFKAFAASLESGTYTSHCHPIKWTCKELGIRNSRKSIDAIFKAS